MQKLQDTLKREGNSPTIIIILNSKIKGSVYWPDCPISNVLGFGSVRSSHLPFKMYTEKVTLFPQQNVL